MNPRRSPLTGLTTLALLSTLACDQGNSPDELRAIAIGELVLAEDGIYGSDGEALLSEDQLTAIYFGGDARRLTMTVDADLLVDQLGDAEIDLTAMVTLPDGRSEVLDLNTDNDELTVELPWVGFGHYELALTEVSVDGYTLIEDAVISQGMTILQRSAFLAANELSAGTDQPAANNQPIDEITSAPSASSCIMPHALFGTATDDTLYGAYGMLNMLIGHGGDDDITGRDCSDTIDGGSGDDTLHGGGGDDDIYGGDGYDTIHGGGGGDSINGGDRADVIYGGGDNDTIHGDNGADELHGDGGNDTLYGGKGKDTLEGFTGNDTLHGNDDDDTLDGNSGNDMLYGNSGNDTLYGGDGNDTLNGGNGYDTCDGGAGDDTLISCEVVLGD